MRGLFFSFEGPDGSGKTSVIKKVVELLSKDFDSNLFLLTREPGGTNNAIAEDIRGILLNKIEYAIADRTEALLFAASRAQHVKDFIKPGIEQGKIVLCDRYIHSSLVYQGYARNLGIDNVFQINKFAIGGCMPDTVFLLMIDPEIGINRIKQNSKREYNRLDQESMDLHKKVYEGYIEVAKKDPKILVINANRSIDDVANEVATKMKAIIKNHYGSNC